MPTPKPRSFNIHLNRILQQRDLADARRCVRQARGRASANNINVTTVLNALDLAAVLLRQSPEDMPPFLDFWGDSIVALQKPLDRVADELVEGKPLRSRYPKAWWLMRQAKKHVDSYPPTFGPWHSDSAPGEKTKPVTARRTATT